MGVDLDGDVDMDPDVWGKDVRDIPRREPDFDEASTDGHVGGEDDPPPMAGHVLDTARSAQGGGSAAHAPQRTQGSADAPMPDASTLPFSHSAGGKGSSGGRPLAEQLEFSGDAALPSGATHVAQPPVRDFDVGNSDLTDEEQKLKLWAASHQD